MIPYERQEKILEALAQDELLKIEQLQSICLLFLSQH